MAYAWLEDDQIVMALSMHISIYVMVLYKLLSLLQINTIIIFWQ